jgi:hypothetical protein
MRTRSHAGLQVGKPEDAEREFAQVLYGFEPTRAEISARLRKAAPMLDWPGLDLADVASSWLV